jgi:endonuclease/exonuclease/phosphatase family metal-dependent hydrolase
LTHALDANLPPDQVTHHAGKTVIKVITYNLHKGVDRRGRTSLAAAIAALRARQPDVLACQEVFHAQESADAPAHLQSDLIKTGLGHVHVFAPNAFYRRGCHGNATFTSFTVAAHQNIDITESYFERRGILRTRLQAAGELELMNVHFSLTRNQRRRQWKKLFAALEHTEDLPLIACGDFNDWTGDLDRAARGTGILHNALWALPKPYRRTFPSRRPMLALDRIYYRGLRLQSVTVLRGNPWRDLSDHLPVEATFALA